MPLKSSTITTQIWLEVSKLKFSNSCSNCCSSWADIKFGNSFDRLLYNLAGLGLSGTCEKDNEAKNYTEELKILEEMWIEKLKCYNEFGYNKRKS